MNRADGWVSLHTITFLSKSLSDHHRLTAESFNRLVHLINQGVNKMKLSRKTSIVSLFLAVILSVPAFAQSGAHSALPGALNYVEGQANIGPDSLNADS